MVKREISKKQYEGIIKRVEISRLQDNIDFAFPGNMEIDYSKDKYYIDFYEPDRERWEKFLKNEKSN